MGMPFDRSVRWQDLQFGFPGGTTRAHPSNRNYISADWIPSLHKAFPIRVVIRCVADLEKQLWRKAVRLNDQSTLCPADLHIAHVYICGVDCGLTKALHPRANYVLALAGRCT